jgi:uncharacterized membrane protein YqjE
MKYFVQHLKEEYILINTLLLIPYNTIIMIKTKRFKYTPKELFKLLILRYARKRWWLFAWILILTIIMILLDNKDSFTYFLIVFAIIYPVLLVIQFWRYVNSKANKLLLSERHYEIDQDKINGILDEDTHSTVKIEHFIKVEFIYNTYLLLIAKNQFLYIPIDAFESEDDRRWFESEILSKIKK